MGFDIETIFDLMNSKKEKLYPDDFKVVYSDQNGLWIKLSEINEMIKNGIIQFDAVKLKDYINNWKITK